MGTEISFLEGFIPSQLAFMNTIIFMSLICGFIVIVTTNKKYRYLFDYIEKSKTVILTWKEYKISSPCWCYHQQVGFYHQEVQFGV